MDYYSNQDFLKLFNKFIDLNKKDVNTDNFTNVKLAKIEDLLPKKGKAKNFTASQREIFKKLKSFLYLESFQNSIFDSTSILSNDICSALTFLIKENEIEEKIVMSFAIQKSYFNDEISLNKIEKFGIKHNEETVLATFNLTDKTYIKNNYDFFKFEKISKKIYEEILLETKSLEEENANLKLKLENYPEWFRLTQKPTSFFKQYEYNKKISEFSKLTNADIETILSDIEKEEIRDIIDKNTKKIHNQQKIAEKIKRINAQNLNQSFDKFFDTLDQNNLFKEVDI